MIVIDISIVHTSRKREAVYMYSQILTAAPTKSLSQKQLGLSRPVVDHAHQKIVINDGRERDAEGLNRWVNVSG